MSRIGCMPIIIPDGMSVSLNDNEITFRSADKVRTFVLHKSLRCSVVDNLITFSVVSLNSVKAKVLLGTNRSIVSNLVSGLNEGFMCCLNIVGVGYKAESNKEYLTLHLGFSHLIKYKLPSGIAVECSPSQIKILSSDKQKLYTVAAYLCNIRKYDPYKGKGIILDGKSIIRKEVNKKK